MKGIWHRGRLEHFTSLNIQYEEWNGDSGSEIRFDLEMSDEEEFKKLELETGLNLDDYSFLVIWW